MTGLSGFIVTSLIVTQNSQIKQVWSLAYMVIAEEPEYVGNSN